MNAKQKWGLVLTILGVVTLPILVGLPILVVGIVLLVNGSLQRNRQARKEALLSVMRGRIYVKGPLDWAVGTGAIAVVNPSDTEAFELTKMITAMIKPSSLAKTRETADVLLCVESTEENVATYQDGSTLSVVHISIEFVGKDGTQLFSRVFSGKAANPPNKIFRMLGERPKRMCSGIPTDEIVAFVQGFLKEAGALKQRV